MSNFKLLASAAVLGLLGLAPLSASATPIIDLGLVIDSSGSIGAANFASIKTAYSNVLALLPTDGTIAITVDDFSGNGQHSIFNNTIIAGASDLTNLLTFINAMLFFDGFTALSDGIADTADRIAASAFGATKNVIDVSTDGIENDSTRFFGNVAAASAYALSVGINQVNCLGIGVGPDCPSVQAGTSPSN